MLLLPEALWEQVVAHCLGWLPLEACGLLAGEERSVAGMPRVGARPEGAGAEDLEEWHGARTGRGGGEGSAPGSASAMTGALLGAPDASVGAVSAVYPAANAARSARIYTVEPRDLLTADRRAERAGWALLGVWHSHTHTPAYPSPTDIAQAPDPLWHYVLVSLSDTEPVLRSYRIAGGRVSEEPVLTPRSTSGGGAAARPL